MRVTTVAVSYEQHPPRQWNDWLMLAALLHCLRFLFARDGGILRAALLLFGMGHPVGSLLLPLLLDNSLSPMGSSRGV